MFEIAKEIWSQIYDHRWLYLHSVVYSVFACMMVKWIWNLRAQTYNLPDHDLIEKQPQSMHEIVEEAKPVYAGRNDANGNPSATF